MAVVTPPRTADTDERTLDDRVAELEALIEEARQRARRRRRRNAAVALAVLLAAGAAVYAGGDGVRVGTARSADGDPAPPVASLDRTGSWSTPTGPPGFMAAIVLHPSQPGVLYLYPRTGDRVFQSVDGGRSWSAGRHVASRIDALTVDPRNGSILYAGTSDGVLKSTDEGRTWRRLGVAPPPARRAHAQVEGYVYGIELDPGDSRIVYAQTWPSLYRSTNGGTTWRKLLGTTRRGVTALAIHPSAPPTLYAAVQLPRTDDRGSAEIMTSTDSGRTWTTVARRAGTIQSLAVDPRPGTVWASGTAGVLMTRDAGTTWRMPGKAPGHYLGQVVVDARHPGIVYVSAWQRGLFRSTDDGASWQPFGAGAPLDGLVIDARKPGTMYAGDGFGIVKTTSGGVTWQRADAGIVVSSLNAVAPTTSNPTTVYAGGSFGLSRSNDLGRTWTGLRTDGVAAIAVHPRDHLRVLVGGRGIVATRDGGASWATAWLPPGKEYDEVRAIAFDVRDPAIVYAGSTTSGLLRSRDGGRKWEPVNGGPQTPLSLAVHPERTGTVYAGGAGGIVASSTDGGTSWQYRSIAGPPVNIQSLAVARTSPQTLYAATNAGLARSVDGGRRWRLRPVRGLDLVAVAVDPERADTVYVGSESGGVLRSTDGGATWQPLENRLPSRSISTLAFDATGTVLYAGTNGAGLTSIRVR